MADPSKGEDIALRVDAMNGRFLTDKDLRRAASACLTLPVQMTSLPSWPPSMTPEEEANLLELATDYALGNGIVYRPPTEPNGLEHPSQTTVIHAPYSLLPTPFPRKLYNQAQSLQPLYNALYAHVTVDDDFLHQIVGGAVAKVDEFQGQLYDIWRQVKKEGIKQVRTFPR